MNRSHLPSVCVLLAVVACGEASQSSPARSSASTSEPSVTVPTVDTSTTVLETVPSTVAPPTAVSTTIDVPPPLLTEGSPPSITVESPDGDVVVTAFTWGASYMRPDGLGEAFVADGIPPDPLPRVGPVDGPVRFRFDTDVWVFDGHMAHADGTSGGPTDVRVVEPGVWEVALAGRAGTSVVGLTGRREGASFTVRFEAVTTVDGPESPPFIDFGAAYGDTMPNFSVLSPYLVISRLADDRDPAATVTITTGDGQVVEVVLGEHQDGPDPNGNGVVSLHPPDPEPAVIERLGPPPYRYDIALTIAGTVHRATVTYPDDLDPATSHYPVLLFDPPLPNRIQP